MKTYNLFALLLVLTLFSACKGVVADYKEDKTADSVITEAKLISIIHKSGFTQVDITDPWNKGRILHTYILINKDSAISDKLPEGTVIRTPVNNVLVYSSVHSSVLRELGCGDAVKGVCDAQYFNDSIISAGLEDGSIIDCGNSMQPTVEKVIQMTPDAILLSP